MDMGRPIFTETLSFTCPKPMRSALQEAARDQCTHISEIIRRGILKELQAAGVSISDREARGRSITERAASVAS